MDRLPPYDLVDLRLLLALAEHRHFARAAEACGLSQPALSARLRRLETAIDTLLIRRGKRFEGFTPDGERALGWARRILADCGGLVQDVKSEEQGPRGALRLGVIPSATPYAGRLCGALADAYPNLKPQAFSLSSKAIKSGLADFSLDAGLTYLESGHLDISRDKAPGTTDIELFRELYCLVARPDVVGGLSAGKTLSWSAAARLPLGLLTSDMQNRRIIDEAFTRAGVMPEPRFESNSYIAILALVRTRNFATVLPRIQVEAGLTGELHVWDLAEPEISTGVGLVVPTRDPILPVTAALLDLVKNHRERIDNPS